MSSIPRFKLAVTTIVFVISSSSFPSLASVVFSENFNAFTGSGLTASPAAGQLDSDIWRLTGLSDGDSTFGGSHTSGDFARDSGTPSAGGESSGGIYAFDTGGGDIILGAQPTGGDFTPGGIEIRLTNSAGSPITSLTISYDFKVFNNENRASSMDVLLDTNDDGTCETATTSLSATTPAAEDSSPSWQTTNLSATVNSLNIADGQAYRLCFTSDDDSGSGSRDEFGIDNISVEDNLGGDAIAPSLNNAEINGAAITLTFNEALNNANVPVTGDFTVNVNSSSVALSSVDSVSGTSVGLTLSAAVIDSDTVTISYAGSALRDASANQVAAFTNQAVTNNTPVADVTAPAVSAAAISGAELVITFDEALNAGNVPGTGDFTVNVNSAPATVSSVDSVSGSDVTLTLASAVAEGDTVTMSYSGTALRDGAANQVAGFSNQAVSNNTVSLIINEVLSDPASGADPNGDGSASTSEDEFIEFVNTGSGVLDISGWTVADGASTRHTFPASTSLSPGQALVLFSGGSPSGSFGGAVVQTTSTGALGLNNSGDTITVNNGASDVIVYNTIGPSDQSETRNPDLTGAFAAHETADTADNSSYSPGTQLDGTAFGAADLVAPTLQSASAEGDSITLTYSETLDGASIPANGDFTVNTAANGAIAVNTIDITDAVISLDLASAVGNGTITLSYSPGSNPIQDSAGNDAAALSSESVANNTDSTAPVLQSAIVNGNSLLLGYNETLDNSSVPPSGSFTVAGSVSGNLSGSGVSISGSVVTVTLSSSVANGETVTASYDTANTNTNNALRDNSSGQNPAPAFSDFAIGNTTSITPVINEFLRDQSGTDDDEFIEVLGTPGQDLSGMTLLEVELDLSSNVGQIDRATTLGTADALGFFRQNFSNDIENGNVGFFLVSGFSGSTGDDLDTNNDGVIDNTPWTTLLDSVAVSDSDNDGDGLAQTVLFHGFGDSIFEIAGASRRLDGIDTGSPADWARNDFSGEGVIDGVSGTTGSNEAFNTPGISNRTNIPAPATGDLPSVTLPSGLEVLTGAELAITGLSVSRANDVFVILQLSVSDGALSLNESANNNLANGATSNTITGSNTNVLHIGGTAAQINATLTSGLTFSSPNSPASITLQASIGDGLLGSASDSVSINVTDTPTNFPTENTVPGAVVPGSSSASFSIASLAISDAGTPDSPSYSVTLTINNGTLLVTAASGVQVSNNGSGSVTISGSDLAAINTTLASLVVDAQGFVGATVIGMSSSDGNGGSDSDSFLVNFTSGGSDDAITIEQVQGSSHTSGVVGQQVSLTGEVTATRTSGDDGFYLQQLATDGDDRTSPAIFVFTSSAPTVSVGNRVTVTGTVAEDVGSSTDLSRTQLSNPSIDSNDNDTTLDITATVLGDGGRAIPADVIEDDNFSSFDVATDGIDFFESLEAVYVAVNNPIAISDDASDGDFYVVADSGNNASGFYAARGVLVISGGNDDSTFDEDDFNPERIKVSDSISGISTPTVAPGDQMANLEGVMTSTGDGYTLEATSAISVSVAANLSRETSTLVGDATHLTIAGMNVENLDPSDAASKFSGLASIIVENMNNPDIIGLQEMQDDSGSTADGVLTAQTTAQTLITAIEAVSGGATDYAYFDFHPVEGEEGGQPGGNIRVGYLFRTSRVQLALPAVTPTTGTTLLDDTGNGTSGTSSLTVRIPDNDSGADTSFTDNGSTESDAFASTRIPASAHFTFLPTGEAVTVINVHFSSRGGSDPLFGSMQPPETNENKREAQAHVVRDFVESIISTSPFANIVVLGDYNTFGFSSTVDILENSGDDNNLHNLEDALPENQRYSFVFDGNGQTLDHLLVSNRLQNVSSPEFDKVHVNVGFADAASDHDPLLARFEMGTASVPPVLSNVPATLTATEDTVTTLDLSALTLTDNDSASVTLVLSVDSGSLANRDGNGTFSSVTVSNSGTNSLTLAGSVANLTSYVASNVRFTPVANSTASVTLTLTPSDNDGTGTIQTLSIIVNNINDVPIISGSPASTVNEGETYRFIPIVSDIDNSSFTFSVSNKPAWASFDSASGELSGTPGLTDAGLYSNIVIRVNDGASQVALPPFSITVIGVNAAPQISGTPDTSVNEGEAYVFLPTVLDPDGDSLTFSVNALPNWLALNSTTGALAGTPQQNDVGTTTAIILSVSDGEFSASLPDFSITVVDVNQAPVISGTPASAAIVGEVYRFAPNATDADGDNLAFSVTNLPAWASFNASTGELSGTPAVSDVGSYSNIEISVSDGSTSSSLAPFSIAVNNAVEVPQANDISVTLNEDSETLIAASFSAVADTNSASLVVVNAPQNGTLTSVETGWRYTPNANYHGADSFVYRVDVQVDASPIISSNEATATITVNSVNDAPVAVDDQFTLARNDSGVYRLDVLQNDSDVDLATSASQETLTLASVQSALGALGVASISDNQLVFTVASGFAGNVDLSYMIRDAAGAVDQAQVSLSISDSNTAQLPTITAPDDITVNATGLFTLVDLGTATAFDASNNTLPVTLVDNNNQFRPGRHKVYWQTQDAQGAIATAEQWVNVNPKVAFSGSSRVVEGSEAVIQVRLNGDAPQYPVVVPYTVLANVSSAEAGVDHNASNGELVIDSGREGLISFEVFADSETEADETIVFRFDESVNVAGENGAQKIVTITEQNLAPEIALSVSQNGSTQFTVAQDAGVVIVAAQVSDDSANTNSSTNNSNLSLTWQADLVNASADPDLYVFDPASIAPGIYAITLAVTDNGEPQLTTTQTVFIELVSSLSPLSASNDSDGDLIPDDIEGYTDSDGDGIPDYLDAISDCNVVPQQVNQQNGFLIESEPGMCLRRGSLALLDDLGGLQVQIPLAGEIVTPRTLLPSAGVQDASSASQTISADITTDSSVTNVGGVFNFMLYNIPLAGEQGSVSNIVVPQTVPVPTEALYRQFNEAAASWHDFTQNEQNALLSAPGQSGICPPPGDAQWVNELVPGSWCVQLLIQDGGANDEDRLVNGSIVHTGSVGVALNNNTAPVAVNDTVEVQINQATPINVLENDTDTDGDTLTVTSASASFGSVGINSDSSLLYTPNLDFVGQDNIVYVITDGQNGTAAATVQVTIVSNSAPIAQNDTATTDNQTPIKIAVLSNDTDADGDALTIIEALADTGSVVISNNATLIYTPDSDYVGLATISYRVTDSRGASASATVQVTVTGNRAPVAMNDSASTGFNTAVTINVLANDSDADGDALTVTAAQAQNGSVIINGDSSLTYTPNSGFSGADTLTYTVSDGTQTAQGSVAITVAAEPTSPTSPGNGNDSGGGSIGWWSVFGLLLACVYRRRFVVTFS